MGFLGGLFKRKPGGTMVGNLLRGAVKSIPVVGSVLGNGAMMISQEDADKRDLSDSDYEAKYGVKKDGKRVSVLPAMLQQAGALASGGFLAMENQKYVNTSTSDAMTNLSVGAESGLKGIVKKYWYAFLPVVGIVIWAVVSLTRGRRGHEIYNK